MYRKKLHTNKALFISSTALLLSVTAGTLLYADNPPSPFTPTQNIQDPLCLPTDANCYVYTPNASWGTLTGTLTDQTDLSDLLDDKQPALVSGTNIKTINGTPLLGSGDISIPSSPISVNAAGTLYSEALGAGQGSTLYTPRNVFLGYEAGAGATDAWGSSVYIGEQAGYGATSSYKSILIGRHAGINAANAAGLIAFGDGAGNGAVNVTSSNFFGMDAGNRASGASQSNFIGAGAGYASPNARSSNFIGLFAGAFSTAQYSTLLGYRVGNNGDSSLFSALGAGIGNNNIIIGTNISLPDNTANAINIGGVLFGTGTNADVGTTVPFTPPIKTAIGSGKIGIGVLPADQTATLNLTGTTSQAPLRIISNSTPSSPNNGDIWIASDNHLYSRLNGTAYQLDQQGSGITLRTNGSSNSSQTVLNLISGSGITLTDNGSGNIFIAGDGAIAVSGTTDGLYSAGVGTLDPNVSGVISLGYNSTGNSASTSPNSIYIGSSVWSGSWNFGGDSDVYIGENAGSAVNGGLVLSAGGNVVIGKNAGSDYDQNGGSGGFQSSVDSVFIGNGAGAFAGGTASIAIGKDTHNDGNANSIALGQGATNTASNQMMIGSSSYPINDLVINGSGFTTCTVNTGTGAGISCSSDERLKTNIEDLSSVLDTLSQVRTITYNWNIAPEGTRNIGFLAQNLQTLFPQLVSTDHNGYFSVNYAGITPILTKAIQEINANITDISDLTTENTWRDALIAWLGDITNSIGDLYADRLRARSEICIDDVCIDKAQLQRILSEEMNEEESPTNDEATPEVPSAPEVPEAPSGDTDGTAQEEIEAPAETPELPTEEPTTPSEITDEPAPSEEVPL